MNKSTQSIDCVWEKLRKPGRIPWWVGHSLDRLELDLLSVQENIDRKWWKENDEENAAEFTQLPGDIFPGNRATGWCGCDWLNRVRGSLWFFLYRNRRKQNRERWTNAFGVCWSSTEAIALPHLFPLIFLLSLTLEGENEWFTRISFLWFGRSIIERASQRILF